MKKSHLYTRGGDNGTTSLIGGSRIKKCSLRLDAYGSIDELSAHIGLLASMTSSIPEADTHLLLWIQSRLFDVGTHLAMPDTDGQEPPSTITTAHILLVPAGVLRRAVCAPYMAHNQLTIVVSSVSYGCAVCHTAPNKVIPRSRKVNIYHITLCTHNTIILATGF